MNLPDGKGVFLLSTLRECGLPIPLVVITGQEDEESAVSALKAGANDYVVKRSNYLAHLPAALKTALDRYRTEKSRHAKPLRILYGDSNVVDVNLTKAHFMAHAPFILLHTVGSAQEILDRFTEAYEKGNGDAAKEAPSYDAIVLDYRLPDMSALELLKVLRNVFQTDIPTIIISGEASQEIAVQALRLGADDYIPKNKGYLYQLPNAIENAFNRTQVEHERAALKASEEHFRRLIENSSDLIMVSDSNAIVRYCSPSIRRILGFEPEEIIGRLSAEYIHPDDVPTLQAKFHHVITNPGVTFGPETVRFSHKDGSWRHMEAFATSTPEPTGGIAVIINSRDITERKEAEDALLNSQIRLAEAMELAQVVHWEGDPKDDVFIFNDSFYAFLGTTAEAEGGYRMRTADYAARFLLPEDAHLVATSKEIMADIQEPFAQVENRIVRRDGQVRHIVTRARHIKDRSGSTIHIFGTNQDITERKKMEDTIQESETKYRGLVENSLVGVFIIQDGLFRFVNKRLCEIYGYTHEELTTNVPSLDFVHPDDRERVQEVMAHMLATQSPTELAHKVIRKDGGSVHVKTFVSSILYEGRPAAAGTMIDTTREENLATQLRQAQKMEAIGTLAGGIAHDFNNILTALTGYASLLKMEVEAGGTVRPNYIDAILSTSMKASNLTQSLLAFARQQPIALASVKINTMIKGTEKLLKRLLTEDITLKTVTSPDEMTILADPTQIDQILINLAVNARDAMVMGGTLTVKTEMVQLSSPFIEIHGLPGPGQYALLSVGDTGTGMDEATKEHIFEPFFTTKDLGKGTGLGLSTVYGIVKQHNGCITVQSEKNVGTTFQLYFPLTNTDEAKEKPSASPIIGGKEILLVAEDNDAVRSLMTTILTRYGYTVIEAIDGQDAIERFNTNSNIALLLLDSVMPKKNGRQAYDEITATHPGTKVIFTSGYTKDVILDKGIEERRFDFITKPVAPEALLRKVREVLDRN